MKILIAGDLVPTQSNISLFSNAEIATLLGGKLLSLWNSADMRVFNLETPLTNKRTPIAKCGPNLIANLNAIKGIKTLNPTVVTLANNHILDQGEDGLKSTQDILLKNDIKFIGAGQDLFEARKPFIIKKHNKKIGIYACAEHEFTIASEKTPGANPFDPLESLDHIHNMRSQCDYIIVLFHGGKEYYRYPSPYLQKVCRKMVEKGADLVVCQHSHCIGCYEKYKQSTIVYGQGNFVFDRSDNEHWRTSLLIEVDIKNVYDVNYIPIVKKKNVIQLAKSPEAHEILSGFNKRSEEILQERFIESNYKEFAQNSIGLYLGIFSGYGKWLSRFDRYVLKGLFPKGKRNKEKLLTIQNFVECEAHRELLLSGLKGLITERNH